ncbi:hypothetical protein SAJA_11600 [Salinisphaera japonica YTM-1]|uniref:Uncharacterized protein n=1 Tax=Salinisphaera japonica YTM-1 TaxID=1209778 RepID=A0A423PKT6_9GAMM|nr:hypothetical protein SAJA_11600 [Salinisphaera japonica YTM-1]
MVRFHARLGAHMMGVLNDNGRCCKSGVFAKACRRLGIRHRRK